MRFHMGRPTADRIILRAESDNSITAVARSGRVIARFYPSENGLVTEVQQNAQLFSDALSAYHETLSTPNEVYENLKRTQKVVSDLRTEKGSNGDEIDKLNKRIYSLEDELSELK